MTVEEMKDASPGDHVTTDLSEDALGYRSLDRCAFGGAALGVASFFALFHPVMWVVPAAAIVLSLIGLRRIATNPTLKTGRALAIAGLVLAPFFGSWAVAHQASRNSTVRRIGVENAWKVVQFIQDGNREAVHQLSLSKRQRVDPGVNLRLFYDADLERRQDMNMLCQSPPLKDMLAAGKDGQFDFVRVWTMQSRSGEDDVHVLFRFQQKDASGTRTKLIDIQLAREWDDEAEEADWRLSSVRIGK